MKFILDLRSKYVKYIYADHNQSRSVIKAVKYSLESLKEGGEGLNIGAGRVRLHQNIKNLDIFPGEEIDCVGYAENLPFKDEKFRIVITQETLEHVKDPFLAVKETHRVLKKDGIVYCQVPFILGYHPEPTDFWRFTKEGLTELFEKEGFKVENIGISVGGATGYYRVSVEFWSILLSIPLPFLYKMFNGIFALILYPIKIIDRIFEYSHEKNRIPGGFFIIARKM